MNNESEDPLAPILSEEGAMQAQILIDNFKEELKKIADETISHLYTDVVYYIESSSWTNFRNDLMDGFRNYDNRNLSTGAKYDFKEIRKSIYNESRDDIIADLNQDNLDEIEALKETIKFLRRRL